MTTPIAGTVEIAVGPADDDASEGFTLLGHQAVISAPSATPEEPLVITLDLAHSLLTAGATWDDVVVLRDGNPVLPCADPTGVALPDPCVSSRVDTADYHRLVILTSQASLWQFGIADGDTPDPTKTACPANLPDAEFDDVASDATHKSAIDCAVWRGLARGRSPTHYEPRSVVTRGQMATFIVRTLTAAGASLPGGGEMSFPDVDASDHAWAIRSLASAGIVHGRSDGTYGPGDPVSRAQMAAFLVRAYEYSTGQEIAAGEAPFRDVPADHTHKAEIDKARAVGLSVGVTGDTYAPGRLVRRDQMATFVTRLLSAYFPDSPAAAQSPSGTPAPR